MNIQALLAVLGSAGMQVAYTLALMLLTIILLAKNPIGKDIVLGLLTEKDHDGISKYSMGRFLLLFVIIIHVTMVISFKNAGYQVTFLDDKNFLPTIDNIEGYSYKIVDFFLGCIFGTKVINAVASGFGPNNKPTASSTNTDQK